MVVSFSSRISTGILISEREGDTLLSNDGKAVVSRTYDQDPKKAGWGVLILRLREVSPSELQALKECFLVVTFARLPDRVVAEGFFFAQEEDGTVKFVCKNVPRTDVYIKLVRVR